MDGGLLSLMNVAVREIGFTFPSEVAPSFACVAMTASKSALAKVSLEDLPPPRNC